MTYARCPCCGLVLIVGTNGTFPRHRPRRGHGQHARYCLGSHWLVEDEDVAA